jgi:hypothetical protein
VAGKQTKGRCAYCGAPFTKNGMTKHLTACRDEQAAQRKGGAAREALHLIVDAPGISAYWMHLEASADAKLSDLDDLLRTTWCECCGHLSEFRTSGPNPIRYVSSAGPANSFGFDLGLTFENEQSMSFSLDQVLHPTASLQYTYDFGSSTELLVRCVGALRTKLRKGEIRIVARNEPPSYECSECGKPATQVCTECMWQECGPYCDACLEDHPCGNEMALPIVNSPRAGVCGYTG